MPNLNEIVTFPYDPNLDPGHYAKVSTAFMRNPHYSVTVKALYILLLTYAVQYEVVCPGQARLSGELDISEKTLRAAIDVLEAAGLLVVKRRGQGLTNIYKIYFMPVINNYGDKGEQATHASRSRAARRLADSESKKNKKDSIGFNDQIRPLTAGDAPCMSFFKRHKLLDTAQPSI